MKKEMHMDSGERQLALESLGKMIKEEGEFMQCWHDNISKEFARQREWLKRLMEPRKEKRVG